ncbi:Oligopeptide transport ATP-binding protein OppF [Fundidesulfovibrio magnetotacticus]|uniref:Oligopeptide transport ATP-binding protein OppF n=1 Tax=Fundidesulfovibrio magnetotacticus TaxID=2730080 RepID=A0A6V8LXK1_9BACT|nr:oligopeptide/dipeptide ABC transporter ATP-binding protein [Fundidesulfovibrio magnetotacticus]GFK94789.1 Oligopeptide transport ATP-binding protein OppF [Fundidesulfovibrio magnetotacticus]
MTPCLEFRDVRKAYRVRRGLLGRVALVHAVDGVDLRVAPGETVGLVGESGCGKSTLARLATGLAPPTSGSVLLEGRDLNADPALQSEMPEIVQMVFQDPVSSLDPRMRVGRSVAEGLEARGVGDKASRRERVAELFAMVGLSPSQAENYPHQFSGGQRQRVAIARALALNPRLVVLDEPVSALDVSIQAQVINILEDLKQRLGLTYLFISHDLAVVSHLSDRVAVMRRGRLVELAPAAALYAAPLHPYTRLLLDAVPDPHGRARPETGAGQPADPGDAPTGCPHAPHCAKAREACAETPPPWREAGPGRFVRCHAP